jgi:hypothetical protein
METHLRKLFRFAKNSLKHYDEAEVRVREATSNDPWGASSQLMQQIADDCNHPLMYQSMFEMLWKRTTDYRHQRHVLKSLYLIEYLLRHANNRFLHDIKLRKDTIQRLQDYKFWSSGKDIGDEVRSKAAMVYSLLTDEDKLRSQREVAKSTRGRIFGYAHNSTGVPSSSRFYVDEDESPMHRALNRNHTDEHKSLSELSIEPVELDDGPMSPVSPVPKRKSKSKKPKAKPKAKARARSPSERSESVSSVHETPKAQPKSQPKSQIKAEELLFDQPDFTTQTRSDPDALLNHYTHKREIQADHDFVTGSTNPGWNLFGGPTQQHEAAPALFDLLMIEGPGPQTPKAKTEAATTATPFDIVESDKDESDLDNWGLISKFTNFDDLNVPASRIREMEKAQMKKQAMKGRPSLKDMQKDKSPRRFEQIPAHYGQALVVYGHYGPGPAGPSWN